MGKHKKKANKMFDKVFTQLWAELPLGNVGNVSTGEHTQHKAQSMLDLPAEAYLAAYNPDVWAYFAASTEMRVVANNPKLDHLPLFYGDYLVPNGMLLVENAALGVLDVKVWSVEHGCYKQLRVDKSNMDVLVHRDSQVPNGIDYPHLANAVLAIGEEYVPFQGLAA